MIVRRNRTEKRLTILLRNWRIKMLRYHLVEFVIGNISFIVKTPGLYDLTNIRIISIHWSHLLQSYLQLWIQLTQFLYWSFSGNTLTRLWVKKLPEICILDSVFSMSIFLILCLDWSYLRAVFLKVSLACGT